jgi:hypothetical protein
MPVAHPDLYQTFSAKAPETPRQSLDSNGVFASKVALSNFTRFLDHTERNELGNPQPAGSENKIIELGYSAIRATKRCAGARECVWLFTEGCFNVQSYPPK